MKKPPLARGLFQESSQEARQASSRLNDSLHVACFHAVERCVIARLFIRASASFNAEKTISPSTGDVGYSWAGSLESVA